MLSTILSRLLKIKPWLVKLPVTLTSQITSPGLTWDFDNSDWTTGFQDSNLANENKFYLKKWKMYMYFHYSSHCLLKQQKWLLPVLHLLSQSSISTHPPHMFSCPQIQLRWKRDTHHRTPLLHTRDPLWIMGVHQECIHSLECILHQAPPHLPLHTKEVCACVQPSECPDVPSETDTET